MAGHNLDAILAVVHKAGLGILAGVVVLAVLAVLIVRRRRASRAARG